MITRIVKLSFKPELVSEFLTEFEKVKTRFIQLWSTIKPMFASKAEAWTLQTRFEGWNESVKKQ
jgi:hypothetical protein